MRLQNSFNIIRTQQEYIKGLEGMSLDDIAGLYTEHRIRKRNGGVRILNEPEERLKAVQKALANIMAQYDTHVCSIAYKKKMVTLTGLTRRQMQFGFMGHNSCYGQLKERHAGKPFVLKMDIKDFFPSIKPHHVLEMTLRNKAVATYLVGRYDIDIVKLTCMPNGLPQGAPTSPTISNLVMRKFDRFIEAYTLRKGIGYTRYADDIVLSGLSRGLLIHMISVVAQQLKTIGMRLNKAKTKLMDKRKNCQHALGVVLNVNAGIGRKKYRKLRGWVNSVCCDESADREAFNKLVGYLCHVKHVDIQAYHRIYKDYADRLQIKARTVLGHPLNIPTPMSENRQGRPGGETLWSARRRRSRVRQAHLGNTTNTNSTMTLEGFDSL